ncbi:BTAD domain-containing putative transcriptional regulator [Streptomyces sp. NPDC052496]|uniref:AfsR/SARP family transcriptional regulator n=1 Tax=Streptomyces sp. NPDC052496 TaxID=3154951 RepID=UPI00343AD2E9
MGEDRSRAGRTAFTLLGPLSAKVGDEPVAIGGPRQRVIMAALVLAWGRVVSVDALIDAVWGDEPPASARTQVAICVGALRKAFKAAGSEGPVIVTAHPGYHLHTKNSSVDVREFEKLMAEAGDSARKGCLEDASRLYRLALDIWSGRPLSGVGGRLAEDAATRLEAQRLAAWEMWTAVELDLGRHQELIPVLSAVVNDYPQHEQFRHDLMLAQYRAGRRVEAAEGFRAWRHALVEELGLEPSLSIQQLHHAILRDDSGPVRPEETDRPAAAPALPAELPPDIPAFIGREAELRQLDALLPGDATGAAPSAGFVTGMAGVGKTSLVVHWAHRVADRFPDGQLHVDVAEHVREQGPDATHALLGRLLRSLGMSGEQIPDDPGERVSLHRSILADRRVLVVLDNVRTLEQVRSLLPGSGRSCVVVTSREQQEHMAAVHGMVHVALGLMSAPEASALVRRIAGEAHVDADPEAVDALCALCDGLPLALRIAAARLAGKPHWSVRHLAARLAEQPRRLDELCAGGLELRSAFDAGYRALPADLARMFRMLSLLDVPDFAAWVGGALLDLPTAEAEKLIEQLVDLNLLTAVGVDGVGAARYRFHSLLKLYARERAAEEDPAEERQAARERAWQGWLTLADEACRREYGGDFAVLRGSTPRRAIEPSVTGALLATPIAWFDAERPAIVAVVRQLTALGADELAWELAMSTAVLFDTRVAYDDWRAVTESALMAVRRAGNRRGEAAMTFELASVEMRLHRYDRAKDLFRTALRIFTDIGETYGRALAQCGMASLDRIDGDLAAAMGLAEQARAVFQEVNDRSCETRVLSQMSEIELDRQNPAAALDLSIQAVELAGHTEETRDAARALYKLGLAYLRQGRVLEAENTFHRLLDQVRGKSNARGEAYALLGLGETCITAGLAEDAYPWLLRSLAIAEQVGDLMLFARANLLLGRCSRMMGRVLWASHYLNVARRAFRRIGLQPGGQEVAEELALLPGSGTDDDPLRAFMSSACAGAGLPG